MLQFGVCKAEGNLTRLRDTRHSVSIGRGEGTYESGKTFPNAAPSGRHIGMRLEIAASSSTPPGLVDFLGTW